MVFCISLKEWKKTFLCSQWQKNSYCFTNLSLLSVKKTLERYWKVLLYQMLFSDNFFSGETREVKKLLMLNFWNISVSKTSKNGTAVFVSQKGNMELKQSLELNILFYCHSWNFYGWWFLGTTWPKVFMQ